MKQQIKCPVYMVGETVQLSTELGKVEILAYLGMQGLMRQGDKEPLSLPTYRVRTLQDKEYIAQIVPMFMITAVAP